MNKKVKKSKPATSLDIHKLEGDIHELARMTQEQFARVDEQMETGFNEVRANFQQLRSGQAAILEAVLEIPSKRVVAQLAGKVGDHEIRITTVERKLKNNWTMFFRSL